MPGATIFFTVCLAHRGATLLTDEVALLRSAVRRTKLRRPFHIDAWVVLPDHMHAVWTLPKDDANFSDRWGSIKARFSREVRLKHGLGLVGCKPTLRNASPDCRVGLQPTTINQVSALRSKSKLAKQDAGIWQRRFWEHHIRNQDDYVAHLRYCWNNPVRHRLVANAVDWPYSSIHRDLDLAQPDRAITNAA